MAISNSEKIRRHVMLVKALIIRLYGKKKSSITALAGGITNYVFQVTFSNETLVIRLSDKPQNLIGFQKEQWAVEQARSHGIPAPEILEVGNSIIPVPYMVSKKVNGSIGLDCEDKMKLLFDLGKYASRINQIKTTGFGNTFEWSDNSLSKNTTWKDYLWKEFNAGGRMQVLLKHRAITKQTAKKITEQLKEMERWKKAPTLNHGDIRLKNILVDRSGKIISIIDWENCTSNVAPYWELAIALHDLSIDEKQQLLNGYGVDANMYTKMAPAIKALNILHYAHTMDRLALQNKPKLLDEYRMRIRGGLDMFSL